MTRGVRRGIEGAGGDILALIGPTGAGKSAVALEVAERIGAEIVAVDAFTVYRGMDIGTAKPAQEDRERIPHHAIDVLSPTEECTVGWFQQHARAAIRGILDAGHRALLVGGSGLYFRAVVDPLEFPPTDPDVRARTEARFADDPQAAHRALAGLDPQAAARIDPSNVRRSVRALEVIELTGRPFSDFRGAWDAYGSIYEGLSVVGMHMPREILSARIDARVEAMLAAGLVEEAADLLSMPGELSDTAHQAIGYAEMFTHLAGACTLEEATERIKVRTRRYAARQLRWFRRDPRVAWVETGQAAEVLHEAVAGGAGHR